MTQCENCLHKKICDLWEEIEGTGPGGYSIGDTCYYFDGIPVETFTLVCADEATPFKEDTRNRVKNMLESRNKPMTNADRIRAMSDTELAKEMCSHSFAIAAHLSEKAWLAWLQKPAEVT